MSAATSSDVPGQARPLTTVRVCLVAPSIGFLGGQAVAAQRLLDRLRSTPGLEVDLLPHDPRSTALLRLLRRVKYVRTIATSVAYMASLYRRLRHYDVVHVFAASYWSFVLAPLPAILVGKRLGKKVIANYHSGEAEDHLRRWPRTSIPTLRRADVVITPSRYLVDVFARFDVPADAIENFIDPRSVRLRRRTSLRPVFLSNRNLHPLYNIGCTLRAFGIVQQRFPDASLSIVGDGPERGRLESLAASLGLRHVTFVGPVRPEEMVTWYDRSDVYLNASNIDNMPLSIIEAFACGLPVVTTRAGGIPYIVDDERNGLLVDCADHEALARQAIRLLDDDALVRRLTDAALDDVARRYTWEAVGPRWNALYRRLAGAEPTVASARVASDAARRAEASVA